VRFAEIAMLAMPFVVFVAWRLLAPSAGPPRVLVIAVTAAVVAMAGVLLVLWYEEAEPLGTAYIPARLEDGRIVPSHVGPIAPSRVEPIAPRPAPPRPSARTDAATPGPIVPGPASSAVPVQR
jgi:hypothetical protein